MQNYQTLALPVQLLKNTDFCQPKKFLYGYGVYENYQELLSDELLQLFDQMQLKVKCLVVFSLNDKTTVANHRVIHSDVYYTGTEWKHYMCGINWEINCTKNTMFWWDTKDAAAIMPDFIERYHPIFKNLGGVHYIKRGQFGHSDQFTCIEETMIENCPTLVRTDIPHSTLYHSDTDYRVSVSIRFHETWNSWEEAVEVFSSLIADRTIHA